MKLSDDEAVLSVGSLKSTPPATFFVDVISCCHGYSRDSCWAEDSRVRESQENGTIQKVNFSFSFYDSLCISRSFSIMYGMRGKKGAKLDGNRYPLSFRICLFVLTIKSVDIGCRTKLEYDVWRDGLQILLFPRSFLGRTLLSFALPILVFLLPLTCWSTASTTQKPH